MHTNQPQTHHIGGRPSPRTESETPGTMEAEPTESTFAGNLPSLVSKLQQVPNSVARREIMRSLQTRSGNNYTSRVANAYRQAQNPQPGARIQRALSLVKDTFPQDVQDHYSVDWLTKFKGADSNTKTHMTTVDEIDGNRIKGCHDETAFRAAVKANKGLIQSETAVSPGVIELGYSLPTKAGVMRTSIAKKTVIKGLTSSYAGWEKKVDEAALAAINTKTLSTTGTGISEGQDKQGQKFQLIINYKSPTHLATFFPLS